MAVGASSILYAFVQVPVCQKVNGIQLVPAPVWPWATRLRFEVTLSHMEHSMTSTLRGLSVAALMAFSLAAHAQTTVKEPWVRGTVAQQKASGAFMQITSTQGGKLLSVSTPVAGVAEVHEMAMEGSTMRMRAVAALDLPAGAAVELKPGGYHVMLMDLKQQLKTGDTVPLTLVIEGKDGKRESVQVQAPVRALGAAEHKH
jgi:copper(I)-binding protein